jgi:TolB-like protein
MNFLTCASILLCVAALGSGCATGSTLHEQESVLIAANYKAADSLILGQAAEPKLSSINGKMVLVATVVDLHNLEKSASLGRLVSEQVSARLSQLGLNVKEVKLRGSLFVSNSQGEFLLSREIKEISQSHSAEFVIVGTYAAASEAIYITLKLIKTEDGRILNGYSFGLINDKNMQSLLK